MCMLSHCSCVQLFTTLWTVTHQTPLSMGILQARILEWVAMPSSRGSCWPRDQTWISRIAGRFFTVSATICSVWIILIHFIYQFFQYLIACFHFLPHNHQQMNRKTHLLAFYKEDQDSANAFRCSVGSLQANHFCYCCLVAKLCPTLLQPHGL